MLVFLMVHVYPFFFFFFFAPVTVFVPFFFKSKQQQQQQQQQQQIISHVSDVIADFGFKFEHFNLKNC